MDETGPIWSHIDQNSSAWKEFPSNKPDFGEKSIQNFNYIAHPRDETQSAPRPTKL